MTSLIRFSVPMVFFSLMGLAACSPAQQSANTAAAPTSEGANHGAPVMLTQIAITGTTYYVSTSGSDSANGSSATPWRTIQHAVNTMKAGDGAIVAAGTYGENVSISSSGTSSAPIQLLAASGATVKLKNFQITGSYWIVSGFDISNQTSGDSVNNGYGVYLGGSASHNTVQNNYIHELCEEGIYVDSNTSSNTLLNNRIYHAEMAGINIDGIGQTAQGNEIWDVRQFPSNSGGIYSVCSKRSGADADGFRYFGPNHLITQNYIHDNTYGITDNPNPHEDCFQTWGTSARDTANVIFERNYCIFPNQNFDNSGGGEEIGENETINGAVYNITWRNNVFVYAFQGLQIGAGVGAITFVNNTVAHIVQEGVIYQDTRTSADQISNNIFYDVGSGGDPFSTSNAPTMKTNLFYNLGQSTPGAPSGTIFSNPLFVNNGTSTGIGADYHLQSGSPAKSSGTTIASVTNDYDGNARPSGSYSIGAYQYGSSATPSPSPTPSATATPSPTISPTPSPTTSPSPTPSPSSTPTPTASITLRGFKTASVGSPSSQVRVSAVTGVQSGDLLIAAIFVNEDGSANPSANPAITPPSGWTQTLAPVQRGSGLGAVGIYTKFAGASEPTSYTFTILYASGATAYSTECELAAYSGTKTTAPIDAIAQQSSDGSSSMVAPSLTVPTTHPNDRLLVIYGLGTPGDSPTTPSGMTRENLFDDFTMGVAMVAFDQNLSSGGATGTRTSKVTSSTSYVSTTIALVPAGSP